MDTNPSRTRMLGFFLRLERRAKVLLFVLFAVLILVQAALCRPSFRRILCPVERWEGAPVSVRD